MSWLEDRKGKPYLPSNGSEGMDFMAAWCDNCARDTWDGETSKGESCPILMTSLINEQPTEWRYNPRTGYPECTAFTQDKGLVSREAAEAEGQQRLFGGKGE